MVQPDTFQHYQILRRENGSLWELGRGAMGVTYKALDTKLRRPVALKVVNGLNLHDEAARVRFLREARAAAALRHRNVASVYHLCEDGEHFFYAMEFIAGETVETWVRRAGRVSVVMALDVALQTSRALGAAARQGLVHRDVKPANLMVTREDDDEGLVVKLIDFGLARSFQSGDTSAPSATVGGFHGTPAFASPEQLNEQELDVRSDIYSLGATLWFMLAGEPPFAGTLATLYRQVLQQPPPWERLAGLPEPVLALLRPMLEKHPDQRPQSAADLRDRVAECLRAVSPAAAGAAGIGVEEFGPAAAASAPPAAAGGDLPEPEPGLRLADGLELGPRVGEGNRGQVFRATDPRRERQPVAVKVFHPEFLNDARFKAFRKRAELLRTSPHPHLLRVYAVERHRHYTYAKLEWVEGFTLMRLLRIRGTLTVVECLCLLQQVSAAADHARAHGLTDLELAPHQILVHFPGGLRAGGSDAEAMLRDPVTEWPEFALKLDAPGGAGAGAGDPTTWVGKISVVPNPVPAPDPAGPVPNRGPDLRAIGILVYELLGGSGAPPLLRIGQGAAAAGGEGDSRPPTLLILGAMGNTVLRQCLSGEAGFRSEGEFFDALARATGHHPAALRPSRPEPTASRHPAPPVSTSVNPGSDTARRDPELTPTPAPADVEPRGRVAAALPAGSPRRRRWPVAALTGLVFILLLANVAWWLLDTGEWPSRVPNVPKIPTVPQAEEVPRAAPEPPPEAPTPTPPPPAVEPDRTVTLAPVVPPAPSLPPVVPTLVPPTVPPEPEPGGAVVDVAVGPADQPAVGRSRSEAGVAETSPVPLFRLPAAVESGTPRGPERSRNRDGGAPFAAVGPSEKAGNNARAVRRQESPRDWEELPPAQRRARRRLRQDPDFLERVYGVRPPAVQPTPGRGGNP